MAWVIYPRERALWGSAVGARVFLSTDIGPCTVGPNRPNRNFQGGSRVPESQFRVGLECPNQ
eukprot:2744992-Prorocentrum_lima.AAC.1